MEVPAPRWTGKKPPKCITHLMVWYNEKNGYEYYADTKRLCWISLGGHMELKNIPFEKDVTIWKI